MQRYARALVDADRASLFLVDGLSNELYARIFDVGNESDPCRNTGKDESREIRSGRYINGAIWAGSYPHS